MVVYVGPSGLFGYMDPFTPKDLWVRGLGFEAFGLGVWVFTA